MSFSYQLQSAAVLIGEGGAFGKYLQILSGNKIVKTCLGWGLTSLNLQVILYLFSIEDLLHCHVSKGLQIELSCFIF